MVRYSCLGAEHPTVQKLVDLVDKNESKVDFKSMDSLLVPVLDSPGPNRVRFSLTSTGLLLLRYLYHFTGYLWIQALGFLLIFTTYTVLLHWFFDPSIAEVSGCFNLEDDLTSVCVSANETAKRAAIERGLENNLKYNLFILNVFLATLLLQVSFFFYNDLKIFTAEHRNGKFNLFCVYSQISFGR